MKLDTLYYFIETADQKSIRKAAELLHNSQPNLSRAIKVLEEEMGSPLFVRSSQGMTLTPFGENLYYHARSIIDQADAITQLNALHTAPLRCNLNVAIAGLIFSDDLILDFYQNTSAAHTSITLEETTTSNVLKAVADSKAEIGIIALNEYQRGVVQKTLELKEMEAAIINTSPLAIHLSQGCPLADRDVLTAKDLLDYCYLYPPSDFYTRLNFIRSIDGIRLTDFKRTLTLNSYHSIIRMLQQPDTFLLGHWFNAPELKKAQIITRALNNTAIENKLIWIKKKQLSLSENAKSFLNIFLKTYSQLSLP